ncbi:MAG: hypothetical protein WB438_04445 [Candidatus Cybelea sp.]
MSEELLQSALLEEAERVGVIDPDVLRAFPEELKTATLGADGKPDVASIVLAVRKIRTKSPALFKEPDYAKMDDAQFQDAEQKFREKLQRHARPAARNNEFRALDSVGLTETEQHALRRYLSGTRNSYDASILTAALKRQNGPDAA